MDCSRLVRAGWAACLATAVLSACGAPAPAAPVVPAASGSARPAAPVGDLNTQVRDAAGQVHAAIGEAACSSDAQCRTIAVGHRACGGPEAWLAWSTSASNAGQLKALVDRHNELRRQEVERSGMASICSLVADPGASCVAQRCTLNTRSRSPAVM